MTVWKTTDSRTKLGVVIYNYTADGQYQLSLDVGDTVHILEETTDWFRGYTTKNKAQKGIFPRSYIHLKEATVHISGSVETITCKEPLLVQEVTSVLKEWHAIWKQLFVDKSPEVNKVKKMILDLMDWRSKLLTRKYVVDEQRAIQQQVTNLIDSGNALLGLDLIVRDDQGNVLDPTKHSTIEIYKRVSFLIILISKSNKKKSHLDTETETRPTWPSSFNLFVMLRNFVCKIGEDADILMNLFDAREGKFISENYLVKWSKQGLPKDIDMLNNFRVVFTDLGSKDRMRERVFLVFQVVRIGVMDSRNVENKKLTQGIRRPLGVAAMDISEIIQGNKDTKDEEQYFIPFQHCGQGEFMDTVIKKVINAREINHRGQGLWVSLKVLPGDLRQVQEEQIHLVLPGTAVARKMGFPEVIMPGDVRNDIYITLMNGEFNKGHKTTDRNVEVAMMVCNGRGEVLKNVIGHGCGDGTMTEYKSMVYYHEDKPKWFETVKIAISTEVEFKGLHVKFVFRHKASNEAKDKLEKPFAMSYVHLMNGNGTTIEDKVHELLAFKIEGKKHDDSPAYLKLPSTRQQLEERGLPTGNKSVLQEGPYSLTPNSKDVLYIQSFVCSTKLTHNVDLLGLLKWQEVLNARSALECHLKHLMREEGEEIVKFLQDLLDSLFNILLQNKNNELCDNLVFDALVYIIALISDRKYHQFRPVLDAYIQTTFSFPIAYNKLIVILKDYVDHANEKTNTDSLLKAIKSLEYIFKIIIRSRCLFAIIKEGQGQQQFEISLKQLLTSINNMMEHKTDHTLAVQGAALKFISFIIGDVMRVFDPVELSKLMVEFIEKVPKDRLIKTKMLCIDQIIQTELFKLPDGRGPVEADVTALMRSVLRTVIQSVISIDRTSKLVENCVAVMISLLRQMTEAHYQEYINSFVTPFDLLDFMMEILMVFRDLVGRSVYPGDWLEMIMLQNRYKDMRREAAFEIRAMWFKLGPNKIRFIPELVGPFLEMTLIPETELRRATIPIFFDMMQCEYLQPVPNSSRIQGNFHEVENEMITQLDALVEGGRGDEQYRDLTYEMSVQITRDIEGLREQSKAFVEVIWKLLERLLVYRNIIQDEIREHRMSCIVNLLDFYHDINRQEMYIRYLHKLSDLHLDCDNFTEAAYTLMLYAKLLQWSDEVLPPMLQNSNFQNADTHRELKERLYYKIISYFEQGKMWEKGIELCDELAQQYKEELFNYRNLSKILLMKTLDPPSEEILSSRKQYLQINSVTPVMNLRPHFEGKAISSQILSYYRVNEVQHFTYSRRIDESVSDVTKMWLERTNMTTTYPLPGIVGWYPVMSTETVPVSPIEYAIENVEEKNKQLASAIEQHHHNPNLDIKNLGMLLNGSVDPAVQGGFANFKDFYIGVDYKPEDQERLKALTVEQKASEDLKPFHSHLEQRFSQMCNKMEQEYGIRVADKGFVSGSATLRRNQSLPSTSSNRRSDGSICSVHMPSEIQPGSMTTPRNSTTSRTQSVWVKDRSMSAPQVNKPQSKVSLSNIKKRVSQVTEQLSGDSSQRNSCELIELNEQACSASLTPRRPPRPDSERRPSRPPSGLSLPPLGSKTNSVSSLASSESTVTSTSNRLSDASEPDSTDEQPPPIPEKQAYADYSNMNPSDPPPVPRRTSTVSTHRQKVGIFSKLFNL
ncbi:hypothetical protein C0Q70_09503 [Pomacea canaliculata]|uniref:Dedicator of cytokinesis protein 1 n=1 Tax=Pomacea canaliculata TaxID=400727 RepID=A0A2T7PA05_POMCA|nr:hypothetical protein C0Q70_09503 [Pomacea canaliculata]